jgi:hypothetical protein
MYQLQQVLNLIDLFTPQPKIGFITSLHVLYSTKT